MEHLFFLEKIMWFGANGAGFGAPVLSSEVNSANLMVRGINTWGSWPSRPSHPRWESVQNLQKGVNF